MSVIAPDTVLTESKALKGICTKILRKVERELQDLWLYEPCSAAFSSLADCDVITGLVYYSIKSDINRQSWYCLTCSKAEGANEHLLSLAELGLLIIIGQKSL